MKIHMYLNTFTCPIANSISIFQCHSTLNHTFYHSKSTSTSGFSTVCIRKQLHVGFDLDWYPSTISLWSLSIQAPPSFFERRRVGGGLGGDWLSMREILATNVTLRCNLWLIHRLKDAVLWVWGWARYFF